jgi:two-component system phosphoglycerate transport system response regulator PgtA
VTSAAKPHSSPAVLVIDDDAIMRELMTDWLLAAGYRVITAKDCEDALEQISAQRPGVVVTDMFMPGPCGEALLAEIREAIPDVAIVAVSGHFKSGHGISGDKALAAGADRALAKPVQRGEFLKAVAEVLHL